MNYRKRIYEQYISIHKIQTIYSRYKKDDLSCIIKQFPIWKKYFGKFLPKKDSQILDIGCGSGEFLYFLQTCGYKNIWGVDISEEQINCAKKLGITNVVHMDLQAFLQKKQNCYDVIFALDVLEHFTKDEIVKLLDLVYGSLKRDGLFIVQTLNADSPFFGSRRYAGFDHEISFTMSSIEQMFQVAGFTNTMVYPLEPVVHGVKSAVRWLLWKCIKQFLKFYIVVETGSSKGYILTQNLIAIARKK